MAAAGDPEWTAATSTGDVDLRHLATEAAREAWAEETGRLPRHFSPASHVGEIKEHEQAVRQALGLVSKHGADPES